MQQDMRVDASVGHNDDRLESIELEQGFQQWYQYGVEEPFRSMIRFLEWRVFIVRGDERRQISLPRAEFFLAKLSELDNFRFCNRYSSGIQRRSGIPDSLCCLVGLLVVRAEKMSDGPHIRNSRAEVLALSCNLEDAVGSLRGIWWPGAGSVFFLARVFDG